MVEAQHTGVQENGFDVQRVQKYQTVLFRGGYHFWRKHKNEVLAVFDAGCSDFLDEDTRINQKEKIGAQMVQTSTTVILLRENGTGRTVGFTSLFPRPMSLTSATMLLEEDFAGEGLTEKQAEDREFRTATVGWTVIDPVERDQGGWSLMMDELDKQFERSSEFDEMVRVVREEDGYANNVLSRYREKGYELVYESTRNYFGRQRYFRFRKPQVTQPALV